MARVHPERAGQIRFERAAAIRAEVARAVPLYAGIETLKAKGDQVQWGGRMLYADGRFATPDGKAHFAAVTPREVRLKANTTDTRPTTETGPATDPRSVLSGVSRTFRVSTRRGKQFNSMVQREVDPLTGAGRDEVFISPEDLLRLQLQNGAVVELRSASGFEPVTDACYP